MPRNSGAFWMPTGTLTLSAMAPKNRTRWAPLAGGRGGCAISQDAPAATAKRALSIVSGTLPSATVTATGTRPRTSASVHSTSARRSSRPSLCTSVPRPNTAMPEAPLLMAASTWGDRASRRNPPASSKKAYSIG